MKNTSDLVKIAKDLWNKLCGYKQGGKDRPYMLIVDALDRERRLGLAKGRREKVDHYEWSIKILTKDLETWKQSAMKLYEKSTKVPISFLLKGAHSICSAHQVRDPQCVRCNVLVDRVIMPSEEELIQDAVDEIIGEDAVESHMKEVLSELAIKLCAEYTRLAISETLKESRVNELIDRCNHYYKKTDGSMSWPNTREGYILKMVYKATCQLKHKGE